MKHSWWKVPAYCILAGWVCFQLMVRVLGRFALVTLPDGTITSDNTRWMLLSGLVFVAAVVVGGLVFFRRMTRRELLCSASVMVALNAVGGLIAYKTSSTFSFFWMEIGEWSSFVSQLLFRMNVNEWVSAAITWAVPLLFVLFGKKAVAKSEDEVVKYPS